MSVSSGPSLTNTCFITLLSPSPELNLLVCRVAVALIVWVLKLLNLLETGSQPVGLDQSVSCRIIHTQESQNSLTKEKKKKICYTKLYLFFQIFLMKYCLIAAEIIFKWRNLRKRNQSMNELLITDLHALVETINVLCKSLIWCVAFWGVMEQIRWWLWG